jgi:hypothetical protein
MKTLITLTVLLIVALTSVASAQTCEFSGAPVGPSQARTVLRVHEADGTVQSHYFGGPAHAFYYSKDIYGDGMDLAGVTVVDYNSAQSGRSRMIDGQNAWFLWNVDVAPDGTQADPPVVAFSSKAAAQQWQRELGGELVQGWDNLWSRFDSMYDSSGGNMGDRRGHIQRESY